MSVRRDYNQAMATASQLEASLWSFSSERTEEEGECEDGNTVTAVRDGKKAEYNEAAAASLAHQLKHCKELLCDNYSLYGFRSEVCRVKVEDYEYNTTHLPLQTALAAQAVRLLHPVRLPAQGDDDYLD